MRKIIYLILSLIIFNGCSRNRNMENDYNFVSVPINPDKAKRSTLLSEVYANIDYIKLETTEECLIGEISQLIQHNNRFYILDESITKSIFCFNKDGAFMFKINAIGNGPGEYLNPASISFDKENNHLLLYCDKSQQVLKYDTDGKFINSHKLDFYATRMAYMGQGKCAFFCDFNTSNTKLEKQGMFPNLIITNNKFKVEKTDLFFSETVNFGSIIMLNSCFIPHKDENKVSLIVPYNDTIYQVSGNKLSRSYYFDFGKGKKSKKFYEILYSNSKTHNEIQNYLANYCNIIYATETAACIFIAYSQSYKYHYVFYNKNTGILHDSYHQPLNNDTEYPFVNDIDGGAFPLPYFTDGEFFYSTLSPDVLIDMDNISGAELLSIRDNISEYDNPLILKITPQ